MATTLTNRNFPLLRRNKVDPQKYSLSVQKYMFDEKCDIIEAQANMDAFFADPNGWVLEKFRERDGGKPVDFVNQVRRRLLMLLLEGARVCRRGVVGVLRASPGHDRRDGRSESHNCPSFVSAASGHSRAPSRLVAIACPYYCRCVRRTATRGRFA